MKAIPTDNERRLASLANPNNVEEVIIIENDE
jgi:hypothetical protein